MSAELLSILDIIPQELIKNIIFLGVILVICTVDHVELHPVKGHPFLLSTYIIYSVHMLDLEISAQASGDPQS